MTDTPCQCATIQPSKFPFVYVGISNPFHIASNCPENTVFSVSSDNADISFVSKESLLIITKKTGRMTLKLMVEENGETKILDERSFYMKYLPPTVPVLTKYGKTHIGLNELKHYISDSGIRAELLNHDIEIKFPIISYNITIAKEGQKFLTCQNKGHKFGANCQVILQQAKVGDILIFDEIITEIPGNKERKIQPLVLTIK